MGISPVDSMAVSVLSRFGLESEAQRFVQCTRKRAYAGLDAAMNEAVRMSPKNGAQFRWQAYFCPHCKQYHLSQKMQNGIVHPSAAARIHKMGGVLKRNHDIVCSQRDAALKEIAVLRDERNAGRVNRLLNKFGLAVVKVSRKTHH